MNLICKRSTDVHRDNLSYIAASLLKRVSKDAGFEGSSCNLHLIFETRSKEGESCNNIKIQRNYISTDIFEFEFHEIRSSHLDLMINPFLIKPLVVVCGIGGGFHHHQYLSP